MTMTFNHVGLLGRREHPGVEEIVSGLLNLLDDRGLQVTIEDRLATLSHFEKREMESRDQIGAMVDLAIVIGGDGSLLSADLGQSRRSARWGSESLCRGGAGHQSAESGDRGRGPDT